MAALQRQAKMWIKDNSRTILVGTRYARQADGKYKVATGPHKMAEELRSGWKLTFSEKVSDERLADEIPEQCGQKFDWQGVPLRGEEIYAQFLDRAVDTQPDGDGVRYIGWRRAGA